MAFPSETFRVRVREARRLKGWTQRDLAAALAEVGMKLDASNVTRLERGTRGVMLDEAIAIAVVLGVSPLHLIVPPEDSATLEITPNITVNTVDARAWIRGQRPLRDTDDDMLFYAQMPDLDWDIIALGAGGRFENRDDFEAARAHWERATLRQFSRQATRLR